MQNFNVQIPIEGAPHGEIQELPTPATLALNLSAFTNTRFSLLAKADEEVEAGQPLVADKHVAERVFLAPYSGRIKEVRRGLKRAITDIVIEPGSELKQKQFEKLDPNTSSKEGVLQYILQNGLLTLMRMRPCGFLPHPKHLPKSIFIQALDTTPFAPPPEWDVAGFDEEFALGLHALSHLAPLHLVYNHETQCESFKNAQHATRHPVKGRYPDSNVSRHIATWDPILTSKDVVWTLTAHDVVTLGVMMGHGRYHTQRVIGVGGTALPKERCTYYKVLRGAPLSQVLQGVDLDPNARLISGSPITGHKIDADGYLGFDDRIFSVIAERKPKREFLHFLRLGRKKFSLTKAYLSSRKKPFPFTASAHGEKRAFVLGDVYDRVMPLSIPTMHLIKALLAEDYEKAVDLGLLEVIPEDFAYATFICPSKIDMVSIVERGLSAYAKQYLDFDHT